MYVDIKSAFLSELPLYGLSRLGMSFLTAQSVSNTNLDSNSLVSLRAIASGEMVYNFFVNSLKCVIKNMIRFF